MGQKIVDGTPVDAATTNPAFLGRTVDDITTGQLGLQDAAPTSGGFITGVQQQLNSILSYIGQTSNDVYNAIRTWTASQGLTATQTVTDRLEDISAKFNSNTGHAHDGSAGNGQPIDALSVINTRLKGSVIQGVPKTGTTGGSVDVSSDFPTAHPSSGDTDPGVVVLSPNNRILLRNGASASYGNEFVDGSGNVVFGRITQAAGVWTITFYVLISGVETAYGFPGSVTLLYYYQQLFNPITNAPIYSEYAVTPSDNSTADVVDASPTQRGLVNTGTQSFAGNKTFTGTIGASNLSGTNTGDGTLAPVGSTPNANAATLTGTALNLQPASGSFPGVMTILAQTLAGAKTWVNNQIYQALIFFTTSTDSTTTGLLAVMPLPSTSAVRLTNVSLTSIQEISGGTDGAYVLALNQTGADVTLKNEAGTVGNQVRTGSGVDFTWKNKSTIVLYYEGTSGFWYMVGGSGSGGATFSLSAMGAAPNASGASYNISTGVFNLQPADGTNPGSVTALAQTFGGIKTWITTQIFQGVLRGDTVTDSATTGSAAALPAPAKTFLRLTNGSLVSISTITGMGNEQFFVLVNRTGNFISINNNNSANGILTGTGSAISLAPDASVFCYYDSVTGVTEVVGGTGSGSGGGGSKNYLGSYNGYNANGDFELGSTSKWSLFNTTLTGTLPTGSITAGAASITTFGAVTSGKLAGKYSLQTISSAAWAAGAGFISDAFTIDLEDQAKPITIKSYYSVISGLANLNLSGTSSNTFAVYIYDVTNSAWIQPAGAFGITQGSGVGYVTATFQTTSNSTQYRLAVVAINASAGAVSLLWDDFTFGPQTAPLGAPMTDWADFPGVIKAAGTNPSITTYDTRVSKWRRNGPNMEVEINYASATVASAGSGPYVFTIPSFVTPVVSGTLYVAGFSRTDRCQVLGSATVSGNAGTAGWSTSLNTVGQAVLSYSNDGSYGVSILVAGGNVVGSSWYSLVNGSFCNYTVLVSIPIVGWSSNVQMSSDTDTRVVSFFGSSNQTTTFTGTTVIPAFVAIQDTHASWDAVAKKYKIPVSGTYDMKTIIPIDCFGGGGNCQSALRVNGSNLALTYENLGASLATTAVVEYSGFFSAGDLIDVLCINTVGSMRTTGSIVAATATLSIMRSSGPAVIAASESVNMRYTNTAGQSLGVGTLTTVTGWTKDFDSHGAFNPTTGNYTCPVSGKYQINFHAVSSAITLNVQQNFYTAILKNGTYFGESALATGTGGTGLSYRAIGVTTINCNAGDTLAVQATATVASNMATQVGVVYVEIERIGN